MLAFGMEFGVSARWFFATLDAEEAARRPASVLRMTLDRRLAVKVSPVAWRFEGGTLRLCRESALPRPSAPVPPYGHGLTRLVDFFIGRDGAGPTASNLPTRFPFRWSNSRAASLSVAPIGVSAMGKAVYRSAPRS